MPDSTQREIAITGASGFIGGFIVGHLANNGWRVRAISRKGGTGSLSCGDLESTTPDWRYLLGGVDTVIHGAAVTQQSRKQTAGQAATIFRVNRDVVAELAEGCCQAGVRRLIFLSSAKVYGECSLPGTPLTEEDALQPEDSYGDSKREAELLLHSYGARGLDVCILRLPMVYGRSANTNIAFLDRAVAKGWPLPLSRVSNRRSMLSQENLGRVLESLLGCDAWHHRVYNVADPLPLSVPQLVLALAAAHQVKARLFPVPISALKLTARALNCETALRKLTSSMEISTERLRESFPDLALKDSERCISEVFGHG